MKQFLLWILKEIDSSSFFSLSFATPSLRYSQRLWSPAHELWIIFRGYRIPSQAPRWAAIDTPAPQPPVPTPAQGVSWVSCVTNQWLVFWQLLSQGTPPQYPEEEVLLVSRTKKKRFFFLFHSPKSQAHKKEYKLHPAALISLVKNCYFQLYCLKKNSNTSIF